MPAAFFLLGLGSPHPVIGGCGVLLGAEATPSRVPRTPTRCCRGGAMLTPREAELLRLVCEGCTNQEIAARMHLGFETVCGYRKNLLLKLNARNTAVLVRRALEQRLV